MKRLLIPLLALALMGAQPAKYPPLLPEAAIVEVGSIACPGEFITVRGYNLFGSDKWIEARTFSVYRDGKLVVILYMEFPPVDEDAPLSKIVVIPEDEYPKELTFDELVAQYPTACSLLKPRA